MRFAAAFGLALLLLAASRPARSEVTWASTYEGALEQARSEQKFIMVDFYTHWCGWCKVLDSRTYTDAGVSKLTDKMVSVKVNAEARRDLAGRFGVHSYPTIVFLNPDESVRTSIRGFRPPERFIPVLKDVLRIDSERFAMKNQLRTNPDDVRLRLDFAHLLARGGDLEGAAAQFDTVLARGRLDGADRAGVELERLILEARAGRNEREVRKGLERWVKKQKRHVRLTEGQFYLAGLEARDGNSKKARKLYEEVVKSSPDSWLAEASRERLAD